MGLFSKELTVNECINRSRTEKGAVLLDVRDRGAYKEKYISGSLNIPLPELAALVPSKIKDKETRIYVIGSLTNYPGKAVRELKKMGYKNVFLGSTMENHHGLMMHG